MQKKVLTVYQMFERSRKFFPDNDSLIYVIDGWSSNGRNPGLIKKQYGEFQSEVDSFAKILSVVGVGINDMVVLCLPNSMNLAAAYLAVSKLGATSVMLNHVLPKERQDALISDIGPRAIVSEETMGELRLKYFNSTSYLHGGFVAKSYPNATSVILYSSGTTGEQKGVELTQSNLYHNIMYTSVLTGMTPKDKLMCCVPLFHCFGLNFVLGACFYTGATLILHQPFKPDEVLESIVRNKVTMFFGTPPMYQHFLENDVDPFYFSGVRYFFYAAATLPMEFIIKWQEKYGKWIHSGYGLTETSPFATYFHREGLTRGEQAWGIPSVGRGIAGVEVEVVDDHRRSMVMPRGYGTRDFSLYCGEVCIRGHNLMKGYFDQPEETVKVIDKNGWFYTGDIGFKDEYGDLYIVDRKKDMINVGGEKVWPAIIEKIILGHPGVVGAAVIGVSHEKMGEVPKAFVVLKKGAEATVEEIQNFIKPHLTGQEFPRSMEFIDKLPTNPSGKVLKKLLRTM